MIELIKLIQFTPIIPLLLGVLIWKKSSSFIKFQIILIASSLVSDLLGNLSAYYLGNNLYIYYSTILIQVTIFSFSIKHIKPFNISKRTIYSLALLHFLACIITIIFLKMESAYVITSLFYSAAILLLCFLAIYNFLKQSTEQLRATNPVFIVICAYILYCMSSFILDAFYFTVKPKDALLLMCTKQIFYLIFNFLISLSFIIILKRK